MFDLWADAGIAESDSAEFAIALADVADFVEGDSAEFAIALADVAEFVESESAEFADAFTDGVAFCSAFCMLDDVAALDAFMELPQVSLNSLSDCSSRSNSSWSGTPCGA